MGTESNDYFELQLINFRCWNNSKFILKTGLNLLNGDSGSGKSTICEAIYFVLFGTLKNVCSKDFKDKETKVILTFYSRDPSKQCYQIIRCRPILLTVEYRHGSNHQILSKTDAQNWIDNLYGSSKVWLSSSYLSQGTRHFLMTSSNAEKMNLFQEITFGDVSEQNCPDFYILKLKNLIVKISDSITKNCNAKQIHENIAHSFKVKNENYFTFGFIDESNSWSDEVEKNNLIKQCEECTKNYYLMTQAKKIQFSLQNIPNIMFTDENEKEIVHYVKYLEHIKLKNSLCNVDELKELIQNKINEENVNKDLYLYSIYISEGYNTNDDIKIFIQSLLKKKEEYEQYIKKYQENLTIQQNNEHLKKLHDQKTQLYFQKYNVYKTYINELEIYKNKKESLKNFYFSFLKLNKYPTLEEITFFFSNEDLDKKIKECYFMYINYIKLGWKYNTIDRFIEKIKNDNVAYNNYLEKLEKNKKIQLINEKNKEINLSRKISYESKVKEYNIYIQKLNSYEDLKKTYEDFKLKNPKEYITIKNFNEIGNDDLSSTYIFKVISYLDILLKELFCPHCENGLIYQNGLLCKGKLTLNEKTYYEQLYDLSKLEFIKRKEYEKYENNLLKNQKPDFMDIPVEESYFDVIDIQNLTPVKKPITDFCEIPCYDYQYVLDFNQCKNMYNEFMHLKIPEKIEEPSPVEHLILTTELVIEKKEPVKCNIFNVPFYSYKEVKLLEIYLKNKERYESVFNYNGPIYENVNEINLKCNNLMQLKADYEKNNKEKESLLKQLKSYPKIDEHIVTKIKDIQNQIAQKDFKIKCGSIVREYSKMCETVSFYEKEIYRETKIYNSYVKMSKLISELGSKYIQETIDDINSSIKIILEDLFVKPIDVKISTHKTLKNGNEKLEINLEISYNGLTYDSSSFLSGGEQDRISLALLLAFSRLRNEPLILLDEEIASLDSSLREKAIEIISKWGEDKVIVHCCHEIVQGMHDHVINM